MVTRSVLVGRGRTPSCVKVSFYTVSPVKEERPHGEGFVGWNLGGPARVDGILEHFTKPVRRRLLVAALSAL